MEKLIILNHKMSLLYDDVVNYIDKTNQIETDNNLIICPSNIYLESFMNNSYWAIGCQDVSDKLDNNHTGMISTLQLKSLGVEYCIVGHQELNNTKEEIKDKLNACLDSNIIPILVINDYEDLNILDEIEHIEFIVIVYEDDAFDEEEVVHIYNELYDKYQIQPNLIYGGNVNEDNISTIFNTPELNGVMIGSSSSDLEKILNLINIVK